LLRKAVNGESRSSQSQTLDLSDLTVSNIVAGKLAYITPNSRRVKDFIAGGADKPVAELRPPSETEASDARKAEATPGTDPTMNGGVAPGGATE